MKGLNEQKGKKKVIWGSFFREKWGSLDLVKW